MFGVPPTAHVNLHNRYPKQYHVKPGVITDFLTMNTTYGSAGEGIKGHSCFNGNAGLGPRTRRAVNYVVNRPAALAQRGAFAGTPTTQILPPTMPGFHNWTKQLGYPTDRPNVSKARSLRAEEVQHRLLRRHEPDLDRDHAAGQVRPVEDRDQLRHQDVPFAVRIAKEGHRGEPYDLDLQAWGADYPDPVDFIDILLDGRNIQAENNNNNAYFNNASFNNRMKSAGRISNLSKRYAAWALIDRDVMKKQAPLAPLFFRTVREFTSKRVGCYSYQPIYAVMNFNAVCIK